MKIVPQKFLWPQKVQTRSNSGETKTTGITTISRLPSHPCSVNFGSVWILINYPFWLMAHSASLTSNIAKMPTRTELPVTVRLKCGLSNGVALLGITAPFPEFLSLLRRGCVQCRLPSTY